MLFSIPLFCFPNECRAFRISSMVTSDLARFAVTHFLNDFPLLLILIFCLLLFIYLFIYFFIPFSGPSAKRSVHFAISTNMLGWCKCHLNYL